MKAISALSRFSLFFDNKTRETTHQTTRSQTGFGSMATSNSTASSRSTYLEQEPQVVPGSRIDSNKLKKLLNEKFGSEYRLELRSDTYSIYANGKLSEGEIMYCQFRFAEWWEALGSE